MHTSLPKHLWNTVDTSLLSSHLCSLFFPTLFHCGFRMQKHGTTSRLHTFAYEISKWKPLLIVFQWLTKQWLTIKLIWPGMDNWRLAWDRTWSIFSPQKENIHIFIIIIIIISNKCQILFKKCWVYVFHEKLGKRGRGGGSANMLVPNCKYAGVDCSLKLSSPNGRLVLRSVFVKSDNILYLFPKNKSDF